MEVCTIELVANARLCPLKMPWDGCSIERESCPLDPMISDRTVKGEEASNLFISITVLLTSQALHASGKDRDIMLEALRG